MYKLNTAAIFSLGHPYIESTTVLSDIFLHIVHIFCNFVLCCIDTVPARSAHIQISPPILVFCYANDFHISLCFATCVIIVDCHK